MTIFLLTDGKGMLEPFGNRDAAERAKRHMEREYGKSFRVIKKKVQYTWENPVRLTPRIRDSLPSSFS